MEKRVREKYITAFVIAFAGCMLCFLPIMIPNGGRFFLYGDYNKQQITFYTHLIGAVRSGGLSGWDAFADLGSDTAASYSFYLLGSPFFWLMTLFPARLAVTLMPLFIALKSGIAAVGAYAYARLFVKNTRAALIASVLFGLSAYNSVNVLFNHFHDAVLLLPFMLLSLEKLIRQGRHGFFALTVALAAFTNYYFFFGQVIFLLIYFVTGLISGRFGITARRFAAVALEAVCGTLLAAVLLLPSAMSVLGNPRLEAALSGADLIRYSEPSNYLFILKNLLLLPDITLLNNFGMTTAQSSGCFAGAVCVFPLCGAIAYFRCVKGRDHFKLLMTVCTVMMFVPALNQAFSLFNATFYGRWFYMPALISAVMTARAAEMWEQDGAALKKGLLPAAVITGAAAAASLTVTLLAKYNVIGLSFSNYAYALIQPVFALTALALLAMPMLRPAPEDRALLTRQLLTRTAGFCIAGMLLTVGCGYIFRGTSESYIMNSVLDFRDENAFPEDSGFFRTSSEANLQNMPVIWGYPTVRYFNSTVEPSVISFYNSLGLARGVKSDYDISEYPLMTLLSVKYYADQAYFDDEGNARPAAEVLPASGGSFTFVSGSSDINIYRNSEFIPMGFAFDRYTTNAALEGQPVLMKEYACLEALVLDEEQISRYADILEEFDTSSLADAADRYSDTCAEKRKNSCSRFELQGSRFEAEISLEKPALVFFSVPFSEGWSAKVNGSDARVERVDNGLMAVRCEAGDSSILFTYRNKYTSAGLVITLCAAGVLAAYIGISIFLSRKNKQQGENQ